MLHSCYFCGLGEFTAICVCDPILLILHFYFLTICFEFVNLECNIVQAFSCQLTGAMLLLSKELFC
ncbi:hypothetical protein WK41_13485 [Burkholderia cepacia]|nr:hypothetical protein WK41_13485 [Burkholderia cepacia]